MVKKIVISLLLLILPCYCSDTHVAIPASHTSSTSTTLPATENSSTAIALLINALKDESSHERRINLCNALTQLVAAHEDSDLQSFSEQLKGIRKKIVGINALIKENKGSFDEGTYNLVLPWHNNEVQYRSIFKQSAASFADILEHLDKEFFQRKWGRLIEESIKDGMWIPKKLLPTDYVNEDAIAASWVCFLKEMTIELNHLRLLINKIYQAILSQHRLFELQNTVEHYEGHLVEHEKNNQAEFARLALGYRVQHVSRAVIREQAQKMQKEREDRQNTLLERAQKKSSLLTTKISCLQELFSLLLEAALDKKIGKAYQTIYTQEMLAELPVERIEEGSAIKRRRQDEPME